MKKRSGLSIKSSSTAARHRRRGLTAVALACACWPAAMAQSSDASSTQTLERVEVTGSHIKRVSDEGTTPVQVLRREDIARTGASNLQQLLATLSSTGASIADNNNYNGNTSAPGASAVSLRNFGKQSTLVLLNFRRVAAFGLADGSDIFVNIDSLPLDAIERVEILKTGGSAMYGSDAVAGVINIITRKDFQGLAAKTNISRAASKGRFEEGNASLSGGLGDFGRDGFNVLGTLELFKRQGIFSWRPLLDEVNPAYAAKAKNLGALSKLSNPGNIVGVGPVAGCATVVDNTCKFDPYTGYQVTPSSDRVNLLSAASLRLSPTLDGFAELLYSDIKTRYGGDALPYTKSYGSWTWGDPRTDQPKSFTYRGLPVGHPLNPTDQEVDFQYRFTDSGSSQSVHSKQYRLLGGVRGELQGYDIELASGVMGGHTHQAQRQVFSDQGFREVIGDFDAPVLDKSFFNKPGGYRIGQVNSPEVLDKLFPESSYEGRTRQLFVDARLSGELGDWATLAGGKTGFAAGLDLRHDHFEMTPSANLQSGELLGTGVASARGSRAFGALFGELRLPLHKGLDLELAGRLDKFEHFAAHVSPKIALRYQPSKQLLLRGTVETGFRAPNLTESAAASKYSWATGISDPQRCPAAELLAQDLKSLAELPANAGQRAVLLARADTVRSAECNTGVPDISRNNPNLKPETSRSHTFGVVFEPQRGSSVALDWWQLERRQEIGIKSLYDLLADEAAVPEGQLLRSSLAEDKTFSAAEQKAYGVKVGHLRQSISRYANEARSRARGLDLLIKSEVSLGDWGRLGLDLDGMYLLDHREWSLERGAWGDKLAGRYGFPRLNINAGAQLQQGRWVQGVRLSYRGHTSLQRDYQDELWSEAGCAGIKLNADECQVKPYQRWDYQLSYSGIKNLELGLTLRNVLNRRPPVDFRAFGAYWGVVPQNLEDVMGRSVHVRASYRFF